MDVDETPDNANVLGKSSKAKYVSNPMEKRTVDTKWKRLESDLLELKEQLVDIRDQSNATNAVCLAKFERVDLDVKSIVHGLEQCKTNADDSRRLRENLRELEVTTDERVAKLEVCTRAVGRGATSTSHLGLTAVTVRTYSRAVSYKSSTRADN